MKKFIYGLVGFILGGAVSGGIVYGLTVVTGQLILAINGGPLFEGEDEFTRNFLVFSALFLVAILAGSIAGCWFALRKFSSHAAGKL